MTDSLQQEISLRELTADDAPVLREIVYHAIYVPEGYEPPPQDIVDVPAVQRYHADFGTRPGDMGCMAFKAEQVTVGAAWVRLLVGDKRGYGYVDEQTPELTIAVLPDYRGQGIGSRLLAWLLAAVEAAGYPGICLSVNWHNPARRLYKRQGFVVVKREGDTATMLRRFQETNRSA